MFFNSVKLNAHILRRDSHDGANLVIARSLQPQHHDGSVDYAKDEGLNKSIGIHLLAGVRFKLPIIPIAAYANVKCYLGGDYDSDIDAGNFAFEIGGGFAL